MTEVERSPARPTCSSSTRRSRAISRSPTSGGGVWARGNLTVVNSTVTDNYAEGQGGGLLAAGTVSLFGSTVSSNIAPVGANVGAGGRFSSFGSVVGPAFTLNASGDARPTRLSCRVYDVTSLGHNLTTDTSCKFAGTGDLLVEDGPKLAPLEDDPDGRVMWPMPGSSVLDRIPSGQCRAPLPELVPAAQLLTDLVWDDVLAQDQLGGARDAGTPCDIGAVGGTTP